MGFHAGDAHLYRYCGNNPTNQTDPSGLVALPFPDLLKGVYPVATGRGVPTFAGVTSSSLYCFKTNAGQYHRKDIANEALGISGSLFSIDDSVGINMRRFNLKTGAATSDWLDVGIVLGYQGENASRVKFVQVVSARVFLTRRLPGGGTERKLHQMADVRDTTLGPFVNTTTPEANEPGTPPVFHLDRHAESDSPYFLAGGAGSTASANTMNPTWLFDAPNACRGRIQGTVSKDSELDPTIIGADCTLNFVTYATIDGVAFGAMSWTAKHEFDPKKTPDRTLNTMLNYDTCTFEIGRAHV